MVTVSSAELGVRVTVAVVPGTVIVSSVVRVAWTVTISCSGVELRIEEADVLATNGVFGNWLTSGPEAGTEAATVLADALVEMDPVAGVGNVVASFG